MEEEPSGHLLNLYCYARLICEVHNGSMNRGKNSKALMPWDIFPALRELEKRPTPEQEAEIARARGGAVRAEDED